MAKLTFRDLLTKLSSVYSHDIFIINNRYIIEGAETSSDSNGMYGCFLSPDASEVCSEVFDNDKIIYIKNIRKAKDDLDNYHSIILDEDEIDHIKQLVQTCIIKLQKIESWDKFNFSEEDIKNLFNTGTSIEIFNENDKIPNTTISKALLPLVTEKSIDDLYYSTVDCGDLNGCKIMELLLSFDFNIFQLYMTYKYISLDNEE